MGQQQVERKEKILLTEAQETLLIPLISKSRVSQGKHITFIDTKTEEILANIEYDFAKLRVPQKTAVTVRMRAHKFDDYTKAFIDDHPDALVLHLGCGLDSRFLRVDNGRVRWTDLDLPDVIALRQKYYQETNRYRMVASSVIDLKWMDVIAYQNEPILVIAEGLFMYLQEPEVKELILALRERFPGVHLIFDAFSTITAERIRKHPSLAKTGAAIHWGIDDAKEIQTWADGISFIEEWFFTQSNDIPQLDRGYRIAFKLASFLKLAQKAHRILYFKLGQP